MEDKKVLFRITNLKQYFPLSKKGMYVKANDGISIDIYAGETFGLVGESGCGKSTFGRTILELYKQTDGRTMYYGRTIEELAPQYVRDTIKNFPKLREKLVKLREDEVQAETAFKNAKPEEQGEKYDDFLKAKHAAESEFQNLVSIFGGFYTVKDTQPVQDAYMAVETLSVELNKLMMEKRLEDSVLEDYKYLSR
ncbi:MAG: ATP-binding cassette domain-containing protein, partial [Eubacterium sp.]